MKIDEETYFQIMLAMEARIFLLENNKRDSITPDFWDKKLTRARNAMDSLRQQYPVH